MKEFVTPEGIEKINEGMFKSTCACHSPKHDVYLHWDKWDSLLMLSMDTCRSSKDFGWKSFFHNLIERIKVSVTYLFTGYMDMNGEFVFRDTNHAKEFVGVFEHLLREMDK